MNESIKPSQPNQLDSLDLRLLQQLQTDASLTNQALAERLHLSPATALRRTKRLHELGMIERTVAILATDALAAELGAGLTALIEVTLDKQGDEAASAFEARCGQDTAVQQLYRLSGGPDFMLIAAVASMPSYHALVQRLFTADANVRNVKAFFSIKRAKFAPSVVLPV